MMLRRSLVLWIALGAFVWVAGASAAPERRALDCTGPPQVTLLAMTVQETSITLRLRIDTTGGDATATLDFLPVGDGAVTSRDVDLRGSGTYTITSGPTLSVRTGYSVGIDLRNLCDSTQVVYITSTFPASDSPSVSVIRPAEGGRVTANIGHPIDCGDDCSAAAPAGTTVRLTAAADTGYTVAGWEGGVCAAAGAAAACSFTLVADVAVGVRFVLKAAPAPVPAPAAAPAPAPATGAGAGAGGGGGGGGGGVAPVGAPTASGREPGRSGGAAGAAKVSAPKQAVAKKPLAKRQVVRKPVPKTPAGKKPVAKTSPPARPAPLCARGQRPLPARPCRPR